MLKCLKTFIEGDILVCVLLFFYPDIDECTASSPNVTSMVNARMLLGLIAADAKLVFLETAKPAKVCEGLCGRKLEPYFGKFYRAVNYLFSLK